MAQFEDGRALLAALRDRLEKWVSEARGQAYTELFEGADAVVTDAELRQLDRIDSQLSRERGEGVWGTDAYGIIDAGTFEEESTPHVVCTYHPQIPEYVHRGESPIDGETREKLNETLWEYCERVVELAQADLEEFVWSSDVETWQE